MLRCTAVAPQEDREEQREDREGRTQGWGCTLLPVP